MGEEKSKGRLCHESYVEGAY